MTNPASALTRRVSTCALRAFASIVLLVAGSGAAQAALDVAPITWDIIGLDSNRPADGPRHFPVGARVCSTTPTTNVAVNFLWTAPGPSSINLRPGTLSSLNFAAIPAGGCVDAYFEVEVAANASSFEIARRYRITATDANGTASTPVPRELYVERLVSQSRNAVLDIRYGALAEPLVAVAAGGALNLVVGQTYVIELTTATATQGYEQLESFINFTNTVFQILDVDTTYTANTSPTVPNPNDRLYADACGWDADPNSPNYRACIGTGKSGGTIVTRYTIRIIGGGGSSQALNTLVYDFSGSSFHYNADFGVGARIATITDPAAAGISKSFAPNPSTQNGVSVLTITLSNPNAGALPGYAFVDNLPAGMTIAATPGLSTTGCGSPSIVANPNGTSIGFSNGTVAGNGSCTIRVNVTTVATGSFVNTTQNLFVGATDTGKTATATLDVNNDPPPGTGLCGLTLANWAFPTGFNVTTPAPTSSTVTASAAAGAGVNATTGTNLGIAAGAASWRSNGSLATTATLDVAQNDYFEFVVDTTGRTQVGLAFLGSRTQNGPQSFAVYTVVGANPPVAVPGATGTLAVATGSYSYTISSGLNAAGATRFRIYFFQANNSNPGADVSIDDVTISGCGAGIKPTIVKAFAPNPVAAGTSSTLTFTLSNTNAAALTGAAFADSLPAGLAVAAAPTVTNTCGGSVTAAANSTSVSLANGTIPANGTCAIGVRVTAASAGTFNNTSGFLSTTETGTTTTGVATATLVALQPASIAKQFSPDPILANGISRLTFSITNPNLGGAINGVAFTDTFPVAPGAMVVAASPNPSTTNCGVPTFAPVAGAGSITFANGSVPAGATCLVSVDVTAPAVGTYANVSSAVSYQLNGAGVVGNTASDSLTVSPPNPGISFLKQVGASATGPWLSFRAVNLPGNVFYRFTVENTGDVPLSSVALADPTLPAAAACSWPASLPVASAANDLHVATCVIGPVAATSGATTNTATANAIGGGLPVSDTDSAAYASTALSLVKSSVQSSYSAPGETIDYTFLVTNTGFATLAGPVVVNDDRTANETCPALATIGDLDNFLDPGESITCTASYITTASDVSAAFVTNTATATAGGATTNQSTRTVTLVGPRLEVVKTASPNPFQVGGAASYTIVVTNDGTAATSANVTITDNLPAGVTLSSATGTNWSCAGATSLSCTFAGTLAVGASTTLTLNVDVAASATSATNTATASGGGDPTCPARAGCGSTVVVGVAAPQLTLSKLGTVDNTIVAPSDQSNVGDRIDYTLTVANGGTGAATNVVVSDPRIATLSCEVGGVPTPQPALLAAGASLVCTGSYTLTAADVTAGSVSNTATVAAANVCNPTSAGSTCSASIVTPLGVVPVLVTNKSGTLDDAVVAPSTQSNVGDQIDYVVTVLNTGNVAATGVTVADPLVALSCSIGGAGVTLPTTLDAGATLTCTGTYTLVAADIATGSVANTATTSATGVCNPATLGSTCSDSTTTPLTLAAVLSVAKAGVLDNTIVAPSDQSNVGDRIAYTITVANTGNGPATGVSVADPLLPAPACTIGGAPASVPATIAAGQSLVCTGSYTLTAADISNGSVTNTATASAANACNPTSAGSTCADTEVTPLALLPVLDLVKTATPNDAVVAPPNQSNVGDAIAYTITVTNSGNAAATNLLVNDPRLPTLACAIGGVPTPQPASLPAGASIVCTGNYTLVASDVGAGSVANTATVSATNACNPASAGSTCSDSVSTPLALVPVLATTKAGLLDNTQVAPSSQSNPGDVIAYTITVANSGNGVANGVSVDDPLIATLACTIGGTATTLPAPLAPGASLVCVGTYTLTAADVAAGSVANTATVSAANVCNPATPGSVCADTATTPLALEAVLSTVKTATLDNAVVPPANESNPGDTIAYTITVVNSGNAAATDVDVFDPLLPALACQVGGSAATLPTSLAAGASLVCTGTYVLDAGDVETGSVSNTATVTGGNVCNPATPGSTCTDTRVTPLGLVPVLTLDKTAVANNAVVLPANQSNPGDTIAYTITVANSGNADATNVSVADPRLPSLACSIGGDPATQPATLAAGASLVCTGTYTLVAEDVAAGSVSNTAVVSGANACNPASIGSTCNDTVSTPLALAAVLATTKSATVDNTVVAPANQSNPGDRIAYTIIVANSGNTAATNVTVTDPLIASPSCQVGGSAVSLPTSLAPNASLACTGTYTLTSADVGNGSVSNTATVVGGNVCNPATVGSTCNDTVVTPLGLQPVLTLDKSAVRNDGVVAPNDQSNPGDTIAYTITVANTGNATASNVTIADPRLPVLACQIGGSPAGLPTPLASGSTLTCTGTYTLTSSDVSGGSVANTATVSATNACSPTSTGSSCSDTVTTPLGVATNLTIDKSHAGNFTQGQLGATYSLVVRNTGNAATVGTVTIVDTLPAGLAATAIAGTGWACTLATLTCTRADALVGGASYPAITLTVNVAADAPSPLVNTATVSGGGDATPFDNTDTDPATVIAGGVVDLAIAKSHAGTFVAGQGGGSYSLVVSNVGGLASSGAVSVVDALPAGLAATSIAGTGWACTLATVTCTRSDALATGASWPPITLAVNVGANVSGTLVNTATVSGGGDSNAANNTDGDSVEVSIVGGPVEPVSIPVDSRWAMILLALLLVGFGARRRVQ